MIEDMNEETTDTIRRDLRCRKHFWFTDPPNADQYVCKKKLAQFFEYDAKEGIRVTLIRNPEKLDPEKVSLPNTIEETKELGAGVHVRAMDMQDFEDREVVATYLDDRDGGNYEHINMDLESGEDDRIWITVGDESDSPIEVVSGFHDDLLALGSQCTMFVRNITVRGDNAA
jgi:hypothetical protein